MFRLLTLYRQAVINMLKQQWKRLACFMSKFKRHTGAWIWLRSFIETCPKCSQAHILSIPLRLIVLYGIEKCISTSWTSNNKISEVKALEMCINVAKLHKNNILLGVIQSFLRFNFKHPDSVAPWERREAEAGDRSLSDCEPLRPPEPTEGRKRYWIRLQRFPVVQCWTAQQFLLRHNVFTQEFLRQSERWENQRREQAAHAFNCKANKWILG